jgi:proteic killer suppression protein
MIASFRHRGLKRLFERGDRSRIGADMVSRVENVLAVLNRARRPEDMDLPGFRLHPLKGDRAGEWAVMVRANWRVVFRFENGDAVDVDLVDYD